MLDQTKDKARLVGEADLAFGIQFTMQFPENRALSFTTACPQDVSDDDLAKLLKRMSDASDFLDGVYRLRALKAFLVQQEKELQTQRDQKHNHEQLLNTNWLKTERRGEFKMSESQAAQIRNFDTTIERYIDAIKKLREEIADLEAKQKAL